MKIINTYHNKNDIEKITSLTCACLTAIRLRQAGEVTYLASTFFNKHNVTLESEMAV